MNNMLNPYSPLSFGAAHNRRLRNLQDHATCPHCARFWLAGQRTETAIERDFQGTIFCPECYSGSRSNRDLNTFFLQDGHRVPVKERER